MSRRGTLINQSKKQNHTTMQKSYVFAVIASLAMALLCILLGTCSYKSDKRQEMYDQMDSYIIPDISLFDDDPFSSYNGHKHSREVAFAARLKYPDGRQIKVYYNGERYIEITSNMHINSSLDERIEKYSDFVNYAYTCSILNNDNCYAASARVIETDDEFHRTEAVFEEILTAINRAVIRTYYPVN